MSTIYGHYTMFIFQEYPRHYIILHKAGTTTLSVQLATNLLSSCSLLVLFCYKIHSWKHLISLRMLVTRMVLTVMAFRRGSRNSSKLTTFFRQWFSLSETDHQPRWSLWQLWNGYLWTDSWIYSKLELVLNQYRMSPPSVQANNEPAYIVLWTFDQLFLWKPDYYFHYHN